MMTNLFSSFDPATSWGLSLNWMSILLSLIFIPPMFWVSPSRMNMLWVKILYTLNKEFSAMINKNMKMFTLMSISIFSLIMWNNFMGLFPYIFTSSSHLALTLVLALPLWLSFVAYGSINNTIHMLAHLVPHGTPTLLMPFMVCIETISNFIRPGTLAIRLSANMIAGHLLLTLLGNAGMMASNLLMIPLLVSQILLLILESAVAIIQSYVFAVLMTLYSSEIQ
uniref:ATP synthase subunit a n=1 Tax=Oomorphoides metallicus TaxID=2576292 RepID=A0A4V1DXV1_9CUCU|nr:ATP synthase F0 subunit 6 [Oomorphoides metallicus]QCL18074.1 ATP synthase F0 subunit 6 [Oomorphoides metallicus]